MNVAAVVVKILLELYDEVRALLEGGAGGHVDEQTISRALRLALAAAGATARERIAARNGGALELERVLAMRCRDLAALLDAAGFHVHAHNVEAIAVSIEKEPPK